MEMMLPARNCGLPISMKAEMTGCDALDDALDVDCWARADEAKRRRLAEIDLSMVNK